MNPAIGLVALQLPDAGHQAHALGLWGAIGDWRAFRMVTHGGIVYQQTNICHGLTKCGLPRRFRHHP